MIVGNQYFVCPLRWELEPVHFVVLNHIGSVCNPGEWFSRWLRHEAKVHSYCDPHQLYEQVTEQWYPRHARWETYPGNMLAMAEWDYSARPIRREAVLARRLFGAAFSAKMRVCEVIK